MKNYWLIICLLSIWMSCSTEEATVVPEPELVQVGMEVMTRPFEGMKTRAIADEVKYITALLFDQTTLRYNRQFSFNVVSNNYVFNMPVGNWTFVLVGTGDGLTPDFATSLVVGTTLLIDVMLKLTQPTPTTYSTTREYFYAKQNVTITASTVSIPAMTIARIVAQLQILTTQTLSDSLSYVKVALKNMVPSVNFGGTKSTSYVEQAQSQIGAVNGLYSFTFYSFGSKPLGSTASDFYIMMDYIRKAVPGTTYSFMINNAGDLQSGGLIVNTQTSISIGI